MNLVREDNTFLDELEKMSSKRSVVLVGKSVTLTKKNTKDYIGHWKEINMVTGEEITDSAKLTSSSGFIRTPLNRSFARCKKRLLDVVGATIGIILTFPLWLLIPILIKMDSDGPVFYCQTRVGKNRRRNRRRKNSEYSVGNNRNRERRRDNYLGSSFRLFKFRTMVHDAERETGPVWAKPNDKRITKFGAFLRKLRLDELPQFLNVK